MRFRQSVSVKPTVLDAMSKYDITFFPRNLYTHLCEL